jgi:type IV secretory pathway ATPase VirB11/archaellum biosynthesis ATPase
VSIDIRRKLELAMAGVRYIEIKPLFRRRRIKLPENSEKTDLVNPIRVMGGYLDVLNGRAALIPYSSSEGIDGIAQLLLDHVRGIYPDKPDLEQAFEIRRRRIIEVTDGLLPEEKRDLLAEEVALRSTKLWPILSLSMSEGVTELYGVLGNSVYLDHILLGRVTVENVVLDERELDKIVTVVECSDQVGIAEPFSKAEMSFMGRKLRITVDTPPSSSGSIAIRNLSAMEQLGIDTLIKLGTISREEFTAIMHFFLSGSPVIVAGRTGVGKTTLCNALLRSLPAGTRIVSVEEVREIEDLSKYGMKHTAYEVRGDRGKAVIDLLHRNPDVVFLGELLNKEDVMAFALSHESGFRVMATTHAKDRDMLREKWEKWGVDHALNGSVLVLMEEKRVKEVSIFEDGCWQLVEIGPSAK